MPERRRSLGDRTLNIHFHLEIMKNSSKVDHAFTSKAWFRCASVMSGYMEEILENIDS